MSEEWNADGRADEILGKPVLPGKSFVCHRARMARSLGDHPPSGIDPRVCNMAANEPLYGENENERTSASLRCEHSRVVGVSGMETATISTKRMSDLSTYAQTEQDPPGNGFGFKGETEVKLRSLVEVHMGEVRYDCDFYR